MNQTSGVLDDKGIALERLGNHLQALKLFSRAIHINPKDVDALYNEGYVLDKIDNFLQAFTVYNAAMKLTPNNPDLLSNRNVTLYAIHVLAKGLTNDGRKLCSSVVDQTDG